MRTSARKGKPPARAMARPEAGAAGAAHAGFVRIIIITGMSGAGKALASHHFEDFGFFCVDNLPPALIPMFVEVCARGGIGRVALTCDVRGGTFFPDLYEALDRLRHEGYHHQILFLDTDDDQLLQRFSETRRRHPLSEQYASLEEAITAERRALAELREQADTIVNTSHATPRQLREAIHRHFVDTAEEGAALNIRVQSFGFKHGPPAHADLVFDVRFLANPNYDREIGHLDGNCQPVVDYVMREPLTGEFLEHLEKFVTFCVPQFEREGKAYLTIAIGCTGGRHRSVAVTNWLTERLLRHGYRASAQHRDLSREGPEPVVSTDPDAPAAASRRPAAAPPDATAPAPRRRGRSASSGRPASSGRSSRQRRGD